MTLACEQQTFLLAHHRWWTFLLAKRPSAAISEEKSLPFAGLSEALHVTPSYTLRHTWKGSHCFPSLNECNPFQSLAALPIRAPFWLFCIFLQFQAAILLFESILRSFVSEVYEHTFIFCSTSSDTLATISSRDRPVSEPCLLCRTSFIKPVNSKLAAHKQKTKKTQMS